VRIHAEQLNHQRKLKQSVEKKQLNHLENLVKETVDLGLIKQFKY